MPHWSEWRDGQRIRFMQLPECVTSTSTTYFSTLVVFLAKVLSKVHFSHLIHFTEYNAENYIHWNVHIRVRIQILCKLVILAEYVLKMHWVACKYTRKESHMVGFVLDQWIHSKWVYKQNLCFSYNCII